MHTKLLALLGALVLTSQTHAVESDKIKFNYRNADVAKVLEDYALTTKQKFVIDPVAQAKITIMNPGLVTRDEAFAQLSEALAMNGLGFSKDGDELHLMQARSLQRNNVPVVREVPDARPERMVTWIYQAKFVSADEVNKQLRILTSKDGELVPFMPTNQLLISDWTGNLQRISAILKEIDRDQKKSK